MTGCTSKECEPCREVVFPQLETIEVNSTMVIPSYRIDRDAIRVVNGNVTMKIETLREMKEGDDRKVKYLLNRLKAFILGLRAMNEQAEKFNKEFAHDR
jgi:hypothetical protein